MTIGFIGAGKVGCSLGKYFSQNGLSLSGYYSRSLQSAQEAAQFTQSKCFSTIQETLENSSLIFCTVPDGTIHDLFHYIYPDYFQDTYLVHCSGALSSQVFAHLESHCAGTASLHPICAVNHRFTGYKALSQACFTVEGSCSPLLSQIIAQCGNPVETISAENKTIYHGAAVMASNLVVGLYHTAITLLQRCNLNQDFAQKALAPLFQGNVHNILEYGCAQALTGPVERGDATTVQHHLEALTGREAEIYRLLSLQLVELAQEKNPQRDYSGICQTLLGTQSHHAKSNDNTEDCNNS